MLEMSVRGVEDVQRRLKSLAHDIRNKVIEQATRRVALLFAAEARSRVSGSVARSIKVIRLRAAESPGNCVYIVSAGGKGGRAAHLIEFGTKEHTIAPNKDKRKRENKLRNDWTETKKMNYGGSVAELRVAHRGGAHVRTTGRLMLRIQDQFTPRAKHRGSKPQPFMRPAFDEAYGDAIDAFVKEAAKLIEELGAKA